MRIAIVGDSLSTRHLAPYSDDRWDIWGVGNGFYHLKRETSHFEIHDISEVARTVKLDEFYAAPAKLGARSVYRHPSIEDKFTRADGLLPSISVFPFADLLARFPRRYFTSTMAWLIAFAITHEPEEIGVWGCDMVITSEYGVQKACAEHFLGIAEGRGIKVTMPPESMMLRAPFLYALETEAARSARSIIGDQRAVLEKELVRWKGDVDQHANAIVQIQSHLDELTEAEKHSADAEWVKARRAKLDAEMEKAKANKFEAQLAVGQFRARLDETAIYANSFVFPEPVADVDRAQEEKQLPAFAPLARTPYDGKMIALEDTQTDVRMVTV